MTVRFIAAPRPVVRAAISEMAGWRELGERMLTKTKALCPVSSEEEGWEGPHLRDTLEVRFVTGADPRIMIGSVKKGDVLRYLTEGTSAHWVEPVNASALRWTQGGTVYFSAGHEVKGIEANPFVMDAIRQTAGEG